MSIIEKIEQEQLKNDIPHFHAGDTVRVHVKIKEGDKERIQIFNGVVIARRGSGTRELFTVRRIVGGEGVERSFPMHSPKIAKLEVVRHGRVRRAKLFPRGPRILSLLSLADQVGAIRRGIHGARGLPGVPPAAVRGVVEFGPQPRVPGPSLPGGTEQRL